MPMCLSVSLIKPANRRPCPPHWGDWPGAARAGDVRCRPVLLALFRKPRPKNLFRQPFGLPPAPKEKSGEKRIKTSNTNLGKLLFVDFTHIPLYGAVMTAPLRLDD